MNVFRWFGFVFVLMVVLFAKPLHTSAQKIDSTLLQITYRDTLYAKGNTMLKTNLLLSNKSGDTLYVDLDLPETQQWTTLFNPGKLYTLAPHTNRVVLVTFVYKGQIHSEESLSSDVDIKLSLKKQGQTAIYKCHIIREQLKLFEVRKLNPDEAIIEPGERTKDLGIVISNEGNSATTYNLEWVSQVAPTTQKYSVSILPGKDTTLYYTVKLKSHEQQTGSFIQVYVKDDANNLKQASYRLAVKKQKFKEYKSAYNILPINLTLGAMSRVGELTNVYLEVGGNLKLGTDHLITYKYRSKDYANYSGYQNNIFAVSYTGKRLSAYAGQTSRFNDLFIQGNEYNIAVKPGKESLISIWAIKAYKNAFSNTYTHSSALGIDAGYRLWHMNLQHSLVVAGDSMYRPNAALFTNKLRLINNKFITFSVLAGIGSALTENNGLALEGKPGKSFGYEMNSTYKFLTISSIIKRNDPDFPGINRGLKMSDHSVTFRMGQKVGIGAFYNSNSVTNNFGIDTLLNTNRLQFDMERYGIRGNFNTKSVSLRLDMGSYKNTALKDRPVYAFSDIQFTWTNRSYTRLSLISQNGYAKSQTDEKQYNWFSNTNINLTTRYFIVGANYFRYPYYQAEDSRTVTKNTESGSLLAGIRFDISGRLSGNINYELSKYTIDNFVGHNINGNVAYRGFSNGLSITLMGSVPVQKMNDKNTNYLTARNYMQLSLTKQLNVPVITRKRYHDLVVRLFFDENGNNIKDASEEAVSNAMLRINDRIFVTGRDGSIAYLNTKPGSFTIDLRNTNVRPGMIPATGYVIPVNLQKDMTVDVPYKKGRIITGRVLMNMDARSNERVSPEGFKIIVRDSSGIAGYAITNEHGDFSLGLPAGIYEVSMNPEAFNDKIAPVQLKFKVNILDKEQETVTFVIKQKKREIHFLEKKEGDTTEKK